MLCSSLSIALKILVLLVPATLCVLLEKFEDLERADFDFIVVGGGLAGNVVANRLTENPDYQVLVLEAGGTNENILISMVPGYAVRIPGSEIDWNYEAQAGPALNRSIQVPRGFILGGSSSINGLIYTRGSKDDWDRYANVTGDDGWSWESIQPYVRKNEHFTPPADGHDTTGEFDPAIHGFNGINSVSLPGFRPQVAKRVIEAAKSMGNDSDYRYLLDVNSGTGLGVGLIQATALNGTRSSSATSYLGPQFINRPNLYVLLHAHVTRILPAGETGTTLAFGSVEFSQDSGHTLHVVNASKEIILSAGSIASPQILMNSGIGDANVLQSLGITPLRDLPSVGQNLSEHPAIYNIPWVVTANDTGSEAMRNETLAAEQFKEWNETRTGPLVNGPGLAIGWVRLPDNASIFERFEDPSSGPNTGHLEVAFGNDARASNEVPIPNLVGSIVVVLCPVSRGFVTLNTSNPFDYPIINLNLLGSEFDLFALREGIRSIRQFMTSPSFDGFVISTPVNMTTDDELDEYIKAGVEGGLHPVGTVRMTSKDADWGVVDPDLRVKGVEGLRVVDASIFVSSTDSWPSKEFTNSCLSAVQSAMKPFVPAGHTQAPTYIMAERAADLIKAFWA